MPPALLALALLAAPAPTPFDQHGRLRVSRSGTHLEHADGTPFFVLADTCWTGPALSSPDDWQVYLRDRKSKGFTAVQFNMVSPWRTAPTDADGQQAYTLDGNKLVPNERFYHRLDARLKAVNDAGMLAVPVLCWAHKKGDAGTDLSEDQIVTLVTFELDRYKSAHCLYILAGDNNYRGAQAERWKRIGRRVFEGRAEPLVTTHPTGTNFPWKDWENEKWLTVLGYQSGHGDDAKTWQWLHSGPPAEYGQRKQFTRPVLNLEPPYEGHNGYNSKQPHTDLSVRRAMYWSLLVHPICGVTYGGHGVWSWHTKPGQGPTDHESTGVAKVWREALDLPGAKQYGYARKLFESLPWTELRPAQDLLADQPGDTNPAEFVACAATPDRRAIVVYTPTGNFGMKPEAVRPFEKTDFFDPRTGERRRAVGGQTPAGDLVLVYQR